MPDLEMLERELAELRAIPTPSAASAFEQLIVRLLMETAEFRESLRPEVRVESSPAVVEVMPSASEVRVEVPDQSAAIGALTAAVAELVQVIRDKDVTVVVNAPPATVQLIDADDGPKKITFERNQNGMLKGATVTDG